MNGKEPNEHEAACPRCGMEAQWFFLDPEKSRIEVMCPNCGRYEMAREQFDQVVAESVETDEPEPGA